MTYKLILLRHGQSTWNLDNRFTGWVDVELTHPGREEARAAAEMLKEEGILPAVVHTSLLNRAIHTTNAVLDGVDRHSAPVRRSWRLAARHSRAPPALSNKEHADNYGHHTHNKKETVHKCGDEAVRQWRRSGDAPPPALDFDDERHPRHDARYKELPAEVLPAGECLANVIDRMLPYWYDAIVPDLIAGRTVLVGAHGNSLRALLKHLEGVSDEEILKVNIPTGLPRYYELNDDFTVKSEIGRA